MVDKKKSEGFGDLKGRQLAFSLERSGHMRRSDFIEHALNEEAVRLVDDWGEGEFYGRGGVIVGSRGSGKTHLSCAWSERMGGAYYFSGEGFGALSVSEVTCIDRPVVIDSLRIWEDEEHFLHQYNVLMERSVPLLMTSCESPAMWQVSLPDLRSRMMLLRVGLIRDPDEELLKILLERHLSERGLSLSPKMLEYVVRRVEKRYDVAREVSERIDRRSMERSEGVSFELLKEVLKSFGVRG
jgi:chromosomal replication initiation ATPase DnaA